jgi:hypothetical protein
MYLSRGYNRKTWAEAMEVAWFTVDRWDTGVHTPDLDQILRMVDLLGYSLVQIVYGKNIPDAVSGGERALTANERIALLRELRVSADQAEAFGLFEDSAAGRHIRYTRTYVATWLDAYASSRRTGANLVEATDAAKTAAANAQAQAESTATVIQAKTQTADELAELGSKVRKTRKRKRAR